MANSSTAAAAATPAYTPFTPETGGETQESLSDMIRALTVTVSGLSMDIRAVDIKLNGLTATVTGLSTSVPDMNEVFDQRLTAIEQRRSRPQTPIRPPLAPQHQPALVFQPASVPEAAPAAAPAAAAPAAPIPASRPARPQQPLPEGAPYVPNRHAIINVFGPRARHGPTQAQLDDMLMKVRELLPRAISGDRLDLSSRPEKNNRNRISWRPEHTLIRLADPTNLRRIQSIQDELVDALLPPHVWPQRILGLLKNDFEVVRRYLERNVNTTWVETLMMFCERMKQHQTIKAPWHQFIQLHPVKDEHYVGYAQRVRSAYYLLGPAEQDLEQARSHIIHTIQDAFPSIWSLMRAFHHTLSGPELVEELVAMAENESRKAVEVALYKPAPASIQVQAATEPWQTLTINANAPETSPDTAPKNVITDPRTDDRQVALVRTADQEQALAVTSNCYKCGRSGHWASNCRVKQPAGQQSRLGRSDPRLEQRRDQQHGNSGEPVIFKGMLTRFSQAAKRPFRRPGQGQIQRRRQPRTRGHAVEEDDNEDEEEVGTIAPNMAGDAEFRNFEDFEGPYDQLLREGHVFDDPDDQQEA